MAKTEHKIKPGMRVNAESKAGIRPGTVAQVIAGKRGDFIEVDHGVDGKQRYRPSKLSRG